MNYKGLFRGAVRLCLMLLLAAALDVAVVLFPVRVWASVHPCRVSTCERGCEDPNNCGCSGSDCTVNNCQPWRVFMNFECCAPGKMGLTVKRFYDCNGDGQADCECRQKDWWLDPECYRL